MAADSSRSPQRHILLPGISANDISHVRAAAMELRADKESWAGRKDTDFQPGIIFVETPKHVEQVRSHLEARQKILEGIKAPSMGDTRELSGIQHALAKGNIRALSEPMPAMENPRGKSDKLYVKGHGSALNPRYITTRNTYLEPMTETGPSAFGVVGDEVEWNSPGFQLNEEQTAARVATNVLAVGKALNTNALDVRITSCGGGGSYRTDAEGHVTETPAEETFAGSVKTSIEAQREDAGQAGFRPLVHGYQGDTNSSHISKIGEKDAFGYDHYGFKTMVKLSSHKGGDIPTETERAHFTEIKKHVQGKVGKDAPIQETTPKLKLSAGKQLRKSLNEKTGSEVGLVPDTEPRQVTTRSWTRPDPGGTLDDVQAVRRSHARRQV